MKELSQTRLRASRITCGNCPRLNTEVDNYWCSEEDTCKSLYEEVLNNILWARGYYD